MKLQFTVTLDIDPDDWALEYELATDEEVRDDVTEWFQNYVLNLTVLDNVREVKVK